MQRMEALECAVESEHCLRPARAFSLLGDETRVRILEALWQGGDGPASFSALYDAVEADNSARFNYHLRQLTGQFVRKTEEGYALRTAGENVVRAIVAGSFNAHPTLDPFETGDACTQCGETLVARYEEEKLAVECPACGVGHGEYAFPPGALLGRDRPEILSAFDRRVRRLHRLARDGVCPECSGRTRTSIVRESEGECCLDVDLRAEYECQQCRHARCSTIGLSLLDRTPVVAFHRDHGIDVDAIPYWRFDWCVGDAGTAVRGTDPWRIDVSISIDGDVLRTTLDGDLALLDASRA